MKARIKAIEYYLPQTTEDGNVLKNDNPDWEMGKIEQKTGVVTRHISGPKETAADLAFLAAQKLLASGISKEEIDFLIFVSQSPDYTLPATACILQDRLGLKKECAAFDINQGCSGFIYGLAVSSSMIGSGLVKKGLLLCGETYTKYIAKNDRACRPLFSDGASAAFIEAADEDLTGPFDLGSDGSGYENLIVKGSGARKNADDKKEPKLFMDGAKVFMFTMEMVPKCVESLLEKSGKKISDIDLFVFHQASKVVMENIIRRLDLPEEKVFMNCKDVGNTVSASIPIALKDASAQGMLKKGDTVMLVGFGVGYSWGGCLIKWGGNI